MVHVANTFVPCPYVLSHMAWHYHTRLRRIDVTFRRLDLSREERCNGEDRRERDSAALGGTVIRQMNTTSTGVMGLMKTGKSTRGRNSTSSSSGTATVA